MNYKNQGSQRAAGGDRASKAASNRTSSRQKTATDRVIEAMRRVAQYEWRYRYDHFQDKFIMDCF